MMSRLEARDSCNGIEQSPRGLWNGDGLDGRVRVESVWLTVVTLGAYL